MVDRDRQTERQVREVAQRIIREELEGQIQRVIQVIESGQRWHNRASAATVASALIAVVALAISAWAYFESSKREADVAASEALMRHFDYATQQGVGLGAGERSANSLDPEHELVATHGIYTANTIVDLTEGTDERLAWNNTVRGLLNNYEGFISSEGLPCDELDGEFMALAKKHFGEIKCRGA